MRELKFRICHTAQNDEKRIIYKDERFLMDLEGEILENYGESWRKPMWESVFDTYTHPFLQEWTGLVDKNGKDIYEGDIVVHDSISYGLSLDKFFRDMFEIRFVLHNNNMKYCLTRHNDTPLYNIWEGKDVKVIGNIFENPDLLK